MFHDVVDQLKKIKVKPGETVTLNSGVAELRRDDRLRWKYADSRVSDSTTLFSVIAACYPYKSNHRFSVKDGPGGKFKDRLTLDHKTGNLTIKNMRVKDTGHFKLMIIGNTNHFTKTIKVNVRGEKLKPTFIYTCFLNPVNYYSFISNNNMLLSIIHNSSVFTFCVSLFSTAATQICRDDLNETMLSLIPEEDPNNTSTYIVEPMGTLSNEEEEEEEESGGER